MTVRRFLWSLLCGFALPFAGVAGAAPLAADLLQSVRTLQTGAALGVIVEFEAAAVDRAAANRRAQLPRRVDDAASLARLANDYQTLKTQAMRPLRGNLPGDPANRVIDLARDYSHLPMRFMRLQSEAQLRALSALPGVRAVHRDRLHQRVLAQSLPLVGQPAVGVAGLRGGGTTVAVIDDGIDLTQAAFGGCTAVATPASCRINALQTFVASPATPSSSNAHGTNVAAIVAGVAPDARLAVLNTFSNNGSLSSDIIDAINWSIANRAALNIVAMNMSLGDGGNYTTPCASNLTNPFVTAITNARNAGISVVAAAGNNAYNNGNFAPGLNSPACTPGAVSVGAVYDAAIGGLTWASGSATQCADTSTAADLVTCFSNTAPYLTLLAPGALINAGGYNFGGTSQATPHVAGALAVLRAAYADEALAAIETRLTATGLAVADARSGITLPRLNLLAAARPRNDDFANAQVLTSASGSVLGSNRLDTNQAGEPQPVVSNAPFTTATQSVWWRYTAPAAGQLALDTLGSGFDTRLDAYTSSSTGTGTGSTASVSNLVRLAGNDNAGAGVSTSALRFQTAAGTTYFWAVTSSVASSAGAVALQWNLNTAAQANLSLSLTGPASAPLGATAVYTLTASNAGPQAATGVVATTVVPTGLVAIDLPHSCTASANTVTCNLGEIASGASASVQLLLRVDSLSAPVSLQASVGSDLPDPVAGNNAAAAPLALAAPANADIPLPTWALWLLGSALLWSTWRMRHAQRPSRRAWP